MAAQNLYTHQEQNVFRTWALMAAFLCIVIVLGYLAAWYFNSSLILYIAVLFALLTNIWSYWNSDRVAIAMAHATPADLQQYQTLYHIIENLCITAGLPMPKVYIINDPAPNAFSTGRNKNHSAVAVTTGLLSMMNQDELEGVIAHELSHVGNRDILVSTVAVVLVGFIALLSNFFLRATFWGGGNREERSNPLIAVLAIVAMVIAPLIATLMQLAISRKREYLADASGALLTRYPEGLASALRKLGEHEMPMKNANNAIAHLFIANPFGASGGRNLMVRLFSTHPPILDRIKALIG